MIEHVPLNEGAPVIQTSPAQFLLALQQHVSGLVNERHARTIPDVVRQPIASSAAEVNEFTVSETGNDFQKLLSSPARPT